MASTSTRDGASSAEGTSLHAKGTSTPDEGTSTPDEGTSTPDGASSAEGTSLHDEGTSTRDDYPVRAEHSVRAMGTDRAMGTVSVAHPVRGRRVPRVSGEEREAAILGTAERLLETRALSDISIDDLARGAGISRPTFYFYFPSKDAVFLTLVDRLVEQAAVGQGDVIERLAEDPPARLREGLMAFYETFGAHRAVVIASAQARASNSEARALWAEVMQGWVGEVARAIEAERTRGAAPGGVPARDLAVALVSLNERVLYATFAEEPPSIADADVVDVLLSVWLGAIYGSPAGPSAGA